MFKVGDIITGKTHGNYGVTNSEALMVVVLINGEEIYVYILAHRNPNHQGKYFWVDKDEFEQTTLEDFELLHDICIDQELLAADAENLHDRFGVDINNICEQCDVPQKKECKYALTEEQREKLIDEMKELLPKYNYNPTTEGLNKILDKWATNKCELIHLLEKHPNYNGNFQITYDQDYERTIDKKTIREFCEIFLCRHEANLCILEKMERISVFSKKEAMQYLEKYRALSDLLEEYGGIVETINGMSPAYIEEQRHKWKEIYEKWSNDGFEYRNEIYTRESYSKLVSFRNLIDKFGGYCQTFINEDMACIINSYFPEVKAVAGLKTSKAMNKLCRILGVDTIENYQKEFAKYADAINPLKITRHTILSVHPVDYYTMSFGNSWSSCQTIDLLNNNNGYHGMRSAGTESYMLDSTSMIFYTVDAAYNGNQYELQPKINRNMFHFGHDKLIQGRVYPQSNDGENGIYKTFREIVQNIVAECLQSENSWLNVKGTDECKEVIISQGVHYRDYEEFDSCNVSYYKKNKNKKKIIVGRNPICPCCGEVHTREDCIECDSCHN